MRSKIVLLTLLIVVAALVLAPAASAKKGAGLPARGTWDADMINSDVTGNSGDGVYIAVLDTGLAPNWKDYFPVSRIATKLGMGFKEDIKWDQASQSFLESGFVHKVSWVGDLGETHGTHVTSTILGYNYYAPGDAAAGYPLPPIFVQGIAPKATIIPVKVLASYAIGKSHTDPIDFPARRWSSGPTAWSLPAFATPRT